MNLPLFTDFAPRVVAQHEHWLAQPGWPAEEARDALPEPAALWAAVQANHRHNALLWAEEDLARRTRVPDAEIAANKRAIDRHNQARNDATERVDEILLVALGLVDELSARSDTPQARAPLGARLSSETAGSMVDRLSILALKVRAMRAQCERQDVDDAHRRASAVKLARLLEQRDDLAACLHELLRDVQRGAAWFKVYRQFKMYNDPRFNPQLVAEQIAAQGAAQGSAQGAMPAPKPPAGG